MKKVKEYWIVFYSPGTIVANTWSKDIEKPVKPENVEWPDNAYAFELCERENIIENDETYKGKVIKSKMYYHPNSKLSTLKEIKATNDRRDATLIRNMENNNWNRVIFTRWGNWPQPYKPEEMEVICQN